MKAFLFASVFFTALTTGAIAQNCTTTSYDGGRTSYTSCIPPIPQYQFQDPNSSYAPQNQNQFDQYGNRNGNYVAPYLRQ